MVTFIGSGAFGGGVSIADEQHQAVVVKEIHNVIANMKPIYSNVGKLCIEGYAIRNISELLEIPEGTVKSRLRIFRPDDCGSGTLEILWQGYRTRSSRERQNGVCLLL